MRRLSALLALFSLVLVLGGAAVWTVASAQEDEAAERGAFLSFVEDKISSPTMQIRINGLEGALSSDVRIAEITVADQEGIYARIKGAHLVWSRLALLRGRLDIDLLEAEAIEIERGPAADGAVDPAARGPFEVPELPVSITVDKIAVPEVKLGAPLFGQAATLSIDGRIELDGGALDADLAIDRTDGVGGSLKLVTRYSNDSRQLALDVDFREPAGGLLSKALSIENEPALAFTVKGEGPIENFRADVGLVADGDTLLGGAVTITGEGDAYRLRTELSGNLAPLVPAAYSDFVAGASTLDIDATRQADGAITLSTVDVRSGVASFVLSGAIAPDGFPTRLSVDGAIEKSGGGAVELSGATGSRIAGATFTVDFGGADWSVDLDVRGLETTDLTMARARLVADGRAENLADPARRSLTFRLDGDVADLSSSDEALARALGRAFKLTGSGRWSADQPLDVDEVVFTNDNATARFAGAYGENGLEGDYSLKAADLSAFSGLAERDLAGAVDVTASGNIFPLYGTFALRLDGTADALAVGDATADPLLAGRTTLSGVLSRSEFGFHFTNLAVANDQVSARLEGTWGPRDSKLDVDASLADVGLVSERISGPVVLDARATGANDAADVVATIRSPALVFDTRTLRGATIAYDGVAGTRLVDGRITLSGNFDGVALDGGAKVTRTEDGAAKVENLLLTAGETRLSGDVAMSPAGRFSGAVEASSPDISVVAPLLLIDASGAITADVALSVDGESQNADVRASVQRLAVEGLTVGSADVALDARDLFAVPALSGNVAASAITAGAVRIDTLAAEASRAGEDTRFSLTADLAEGRLETAGRLDVAEGGYDLGLDRLTLRRDPDLTASLVSPVTIGVRGEAIRIPDAEIAVGSGRIKVAGTVAETIDLQAAITALPLSIGNALAPDLALAGTLDGTLTATGPKADPQAAFSLRARQVAAAPLRGAGIDALDVALDGRYAGGVADIDARTSIGGGTVTATGRVGDTLGLDVRVAGLPVSLANAFQPDLGAAGTLSANARVTGTPAAPQAAFDVTGSGLSVAALREAGVGPLALAAEGRFADDVVTLASATVSGGDGLSLRASGRVPLTGSGLDVSVTGSAPLALANRSLASRGATLTGTLRVDARATGSAANPAINGTATVDGGRLIDPETTVQLNDIGLRVAFTGERAVIERLSAATKGGGSITASGSIGFAPGSNFPVDLTVGLREARLAAGELATANLSGDLAVRGPLLGNPQVTGRIRVNRAEITIPETLPSKATLLDVRHRLPPPNVARTLERAKLATEARGSGAGGSGVIGLDVTIDAPARVFVRGRGVDAELGGSIRITGTSADVVPIGSFELIRGRLDIVGQRVTFDSGRVTLVGDLDPTVEFVASTTGNNITVTVTVTGRVSDLQIVMSSTPELPQDEILAQFLFGRSIDELTPLQIARLTAAVAQLAGATGAGPDLLGGIRKATGLDDLDVVQDENGGVGVAAGRYISDNIYLGVTAGSTGAKVSVDLDLTKNLKARVEGGGEGEAKAGLYFEREY